MQIYQMSKFYTALGIKKPYFYDILSGKVNPPPPRQTNCNASIIESKT